MWETYFPEEEIEITEEIRRNPNILFERFEAARNSLAELEKSILLEEKLMIMRKQSLSSQDNSEPIFEKTYTPTKVSES